MATAVSSYRGSEHRFRYNSSPTVILMFGWMKAKVEHLHKYTKMYDEIYPEATQILVRCEASTLLSRSSTQQALLAPVAENLEALGVISSERASSEVKQIHSDLPSQHRVLIHAFSNGGCGQLVNLREHLSRSGYTSLHWPSALVIDSAPGYAGFKASKMIWAASGGVVQRFLMLVLVIAYHVTSYLLWIVFGTRETVDMWYEQLKNPKVMPWIDERTPRLYVFSKKDMLVPWERVWEHGEAALQAGTLLVEREIFEETDHVAHARADPKRYWAAVARIWEQAA